MTHVLSLHPRRDAPLMRREAAFARKHDVVVCVQTDETRVVTHCDKMCEATTRDHRCFSAECIASLIKIDGLEICPVSGMLIGESFINMADEIDDNEDMKRVFFLDPMNAGDSKNHLMDSIFKKIFAGVYVTAQQLSDKHRAALVKAKADGVVLNRDVAEQIKSAVNSTVLLESDVARLTELIAYSAQQLTLNDRDMTDYTIAYLYTMASDGLNHNRRTIIATDSKIKECFPKVTKIKQLGFDAHSLTNGMNIISKNVNVLQSRLRAQPKIEEIVVTSKKQRLCSV